MLRGGAVVLVCWLAMACSDGKPAPTEEVPIGSFCVQQSNVGARSVVAGDELRVEIFPEQRCFSSSCIEVVSAECTVTGTDPFEVTGGFVIRDLSRRRACTDDCGSLPPASCAGPALQAGDQTVRSGDREVAFAVPGDFAVNELCSNGLLMQ